MEKKNILIVDDDIDFAESLASVLNLFGHNVSFVQSGEEAIEKYRNVNYDLAFFDIVMPGKNGVESFLEIRHFKPEAKVVIVSGYIDQDLMKKAHNNGIYGVLLKPFDVEDLLNYLA